MKPQRLRDAMKEFLPKKLQEYSLTSYDVIGNIAVIEVPKELKAYEKQLADILLSQSHIKTVCKKAGIHEGEYRIRKLSVIGGKKTKETIHKENRIQLKLNVEQVYFSPRLGHERERIMNQVKKGEDVLVLFSGCGPYTYAIAKNTPAASVVGIEINPVAHTYAEENKKLNKASTVTNHCGDAKKVVPKLKQKFDRIIMPLPKTASEFLGTAFSVAKKSTIIHFYDFSPEEEFKQARKKIKELCAEHKKKCRILRVVKCGQYSPRVYRICVDFKVLS